MPCSISCIISGVFIIGMTYFYSMTDKSEIVKHYKEKLSIPLQKRYEKITEERKMISYHGYILGLILSLFFIFYNTKIKNYKLNTFSLVCLVMAVCFLTNYFYYMLSPKSDWMLNHTSSQEEVKAWLQMYREMSYNYHMGLALGIVAVGVLAFAFRC
jgi:formate/nitrite transporter FocA (FNT family)